jgi:hypothetical protein
MIKRGRFILKISTFVQEILYAEMYLADGKFLIEEEKFNIKHIWYSDEEFEGQKLLKGMGRI